MTEKELEDRLERIESMVSEMYTIMIMQQVKPGDANKMLYEKARDAFLDGNPKLFEQYIKQGGQVPKS
jgi:hypothetical protein